MKDNKKLSVSIGIPAHNEDANIASLLVRIIEQKVTTVEIKEILVVSDGSKDNTEKIVRSFQDDRIKLFVNKKRLGKNLTANKIVKEASGDILILLDGDVLIDGQDFIDAICAPLLRDSKVGLVGANTYPLQPRSVFETVIAYSHIAKYALFKKLSKKDNVYLCHGRARAFSKKLYKKIVWPKVSPEDSYSYFFCRTIGLEFVYQKKARVLFRAPTNIHDHIKQSTRFKAGKEYLKNDFPEEMVDAAYKIPIKLTISTFIESFRKAPLTFFSYIVFQVYIALFSRDKNFPQLYDTSVSTKKLYMR